MVTGGCGFIGSNFISRMINRGHRVLNVDKLTYAATQNLYNINNSMRHNILYDFRLLDICDQDGVCTAIEEYQPHCLVHFAAETHVDNSIAQPADFIQTNINGTYSLVTAAQQYYQHNNNFKFLHVSTDEVYGSLGKEGSFNETSPYDPKSPYSASKAASDHLVRAWSHTHGLPTIITHCTNNYGPHQHTEKFIPKIIKSCLDAKQIPIYGDGENIRDWIYVEDHCCALDMIINSSMTNCTYDISANEEHSNIFVANKICEIVDEYYPRAYKHSELITHIEDRPGHDFRYSVDSSKIKNELNWKPNFKFEDAMIGTVSWYLDMFQI
jgi:dTDP-glucose 4,6-dehydratase